MFVQRVQVGVGEAGERDQGYGAAGEEVGGWGGVRGEVRRLGVAVHNY